MKNKTEGIVTRFLTAFDLVCVEQKQSAQVIAKKLGISGAIVSKMRKGINQSIRADYIASICATYGFSVVWVMTGEGEQRVNGEIVSMQQQLDQLRIGKSVAAVRWKASQLKLTLPKVDYTKEEDAFILKNHKVMTIQEIADKLGRTKTSVNKRFFKIRPRKLPNFRKSFVQIEDDVPYDNNLSDNYREALKKLKVGQSFVFEKKHYQIIVNLFVFFEPKKFSTKSIDKETSRLWRIA